MFNNLKLFSKNNFKSVTSKLTGGPSKNMNKLFNFGITRNFSQIKNLSQVMFTASQEEDQRKAKFLEYTHKVYKPSKTITFDRNGEALLFSVDNFKHSQVYLKYPYCMIDAMIPIAVYLFFADPCKKTFYLILRF
jgi:hypothetical protein